MTAQDVHVWTVRVPDEALDDALDDALLSEAERARAARFLADGRRREYVAGHVLLRRALSSVAPSRGPGEWEFVVGDGGRPELPDGRLRFNLSHTHGFVACVVAGVVCGIDVEHVPAERALPHRRVLSPAETAAIRAAPDTEQPQLYTRHWTLKEAYAKARGLGLRLPFDQLHVSLSDPPSVMDATADAPTAPWQCEQWLPTRDHVAALVVAGRGRRIVHRTAMP